MNKDILRQAVVIAAVAATIVLNGLANALPLNGQTTGDVANSFVYYGRDRRYVLSSAQPEHDQRLARAHAR